MLEVRSNKRQVPIAAIISLLMFSCSQNNTECNVNEITINVSETSNDAALLTDVFEVDDLIQLESSPECIISSIKRIQYFKGCYYILDKSRQKCVLVFDLQGHFIRKIGALGHGKGEYATIEDFAVDEEGGTNSDSIEQLNGICI